MILNSFASVIFFVVQGIIFLIYIFSDSPKSTPTLIIVIICVFGIPIGILGLTLLGFGIFHLVLQCR